MWQAEANNVSSLSALAATAVGQILLLLHFLGLKLQYKTEKLTRPNLISGYEIWS